MTRKELASQIRVYEKWNSKTSWPFNSAMAGAILFMLIARMVMGDFEIFVSVIVGVWVSGCIYILIRSQKKKLRMLNLHCPICDAQLVTEGGRIVVATLYCSGCGNKILEEDKESKNADAKI